MHRMRPLWIRGLRLYRSGDPTAGDDVGLWPGDEEREPLPHVRSRFRSVDDPECFALYSVRDVPLLGHAAQPMQLLPTEDHTLIVVREFRRVPLEASALALMIFTARVGAAARVIATLAHWAERAVSTYQPAYLLLAHSLEQPKVSALLTGVHERRALQWARACPFSVDLVLPEVGPLLDAAPEHYAYCPEEEALAALPRAVAPYAV